jgi:hypothetical protein
MRASIEYIDKKGLRLYDFTSTPLSILKQRIIMGRGNIKRLIHYHIEEL